MTIWQNTDGKLWDDEGRDKSKNPNWPKGMTKLTEEQVATIRAGNQIVTNLGLRAAAQAALLKCDRVALRCQKRGVPYPAEWLACDEALIRIVNGSDTTSTALPTFPATYPEGS